MLQSQTNYHNNNTRGCLRRKHDTQTSRAGPPDHSVAKRERRSDDAADWSHMRAERERKDFRSTVTALAAIFVARAIHGGPMFRAHIVRSQQCSLIHARGAGTQ